MISPLGSLSVLYEASLGLKGKVTMHVSFLKFSQGLGKLRSPGNTGQHNSPLSRIIEVPVPLPSAISFPDLEARVLSVLLNLTLGLTKSSPLESELIGFSPLPAVFLLC